MVQEGWESHLIGLLFVTAEWKDENVTDAHRHNFTLFICKLLSIEGKGAL